MSVIVGKSVLEKLHAQYIEGTNPGDLVPGVTVLVVRLPKEVVEACGFPTHKVYITARALKHLHERRSEDEYKFITNNIWAALKHPSKIYNNLSGKQAEFLFARVMDNSFHYACAVGIGKTIVDGQPALYITTAFKNARGNYFKKFTTLWSRESD